MPRQNTIQLRKGTLSQWTANNTQVLASGEPAFEVDTLRLKIGDGTTAWSGLNYVGLAGTGTSGYLPQFNSSQGVANSLVFDNGTSIGIGTTTPSGKFHIESSVANNSYVLLSNPDNVIKTHIGVGNSDTVPFLASINNIQLASGNNGWGFFDRGTDGALQIQRRSGSTSWVGAVIFNRNNGNVGIGTGLSLNSNDKLTVDGNLRLADTATSIGNRLQLFRGGGTAYDYTLSKEGNHLAISTSNDPSTNRFTQFGYHSDTTWTPKTVINGYTGDIGIGTTSPSVQLDVVGSGRFRGRCRVDNLTINTDTTTDNTSSYLATILLGSDGASLSGGGLQITTNTNRSANKAMLGLVNNKLKTLSGASTFAKVTFSSEYNADISVNSTQTPEGNFVNVLTLESGNLTLINQNLYIKNAPTPTPYNNSAGDIINSQAYIYIQGASAGSPARFNNVYNYYSRGQFGASHSYANNFIDFYAAPIVGQTVPSGIITTRTALLIDYYNGNTAHITNPRGIWQLGSNVANHLAGSLGIGTASPQSKVHITDTNDLNTTIEYTNTTAGFASGVRPLKLLLTGSNGIGVGAGVGIDFVTKSSSTEYTGARIVSNRTDTSNNHALTFWAGGGTTSLSEYMRISSNGNIGIGTTSPVEKLEIDGSLKFANCSSRILRGDAYNIRLSSGGSAPGHFGIFIDNTGTTNGRIFRVASWADGTTGKFIIRDDTAGADRLVIQANGTIGIGTDAPTERLHVSGSQTTIRLNNSLSYDTQLRLTDIASDWSVGVNQGNSLGSGVFSIRSVTAGASRLVIDTNGNVGIGTATPGYKLQVNGSFAASTKSFRIHHPSKKDHSLEYGSLESPYHGVRLTGRGKVIKGVGAVSLPVYLKDLIHDDDTLNIQITNIKHGKTIYLDKIDLKNDQFIVKVDRAKSLGELQFCWTLTGVRKDVDHLVVEKEN